MNELSSLGLILLLALLAGHLVKFLRIPEVTGYILAGVALGPSMLGWVSQDNLAALEVISEVALGLILFSVGSVFHFSRFRRFGRRIFQLTLIESALACLTVTAGALLLGQPWQVAFLLGAIAIETAPASTLMVLREMNSRGPVSDTLLGIIAINNLFTLSAYTFVAALIELVAGFDLAAGLGNILYRGFFDMVFPLVWQLVGSAALGYLIGLMLAGWATRVTEHGEMLMLVSGSIMLSVGAAHIFDLSPLVASLSIGATMVNLSAGSRGLFSALSRTDPPFYAIFFVLAGADLNLSLVPTMGALGAVYVAGRAVGKFWGARIGARRLNLDENVQRWLGFGLLAQAGLAVGITLAIGRRFPDLAPVITTVVFSSVVIYEMIGPISARFALVRSGETNPQETAPAGLLD